MKKILLLAYTNLNFGDDMFIKTICKQHPREKFVLHAQEEYVDVFGNLQNLQVIHPSKVERIINKITRKMPGLIREQIRGIKFGQYKAVVYVIGALFDENDIWNKNIEKYGLEKVKNMLWKESLCSKVPFFLLGCNMTNVFTPKYLMDMSYIFEGLYDICFRDRYSYDYFKKLGNTRYAPDIVFNYQCKNCLKDGGILISVWGVLTWADKFPQWKWAEKYWEKYEEFIIEITKAFVNKGEKITLLSLCESEGDLNACNIILENGKFEDFVKIKSYHGNIDEIIDLFERAEFIIGTRFHSIIMALNAKSSFYPIIYENKTMQLLQDLEYKNEYSCIESIDYSDINKVMEAYEKRNIIECDHMKRMASKQFEKLQKFLK